MHASPIAEAPLCCHCGHPILTGEPRWAGDRHDRPWHYSCASDTAQIVRYQLPGTTLFFRADKRSGK